MSIDYQQLKRVLQFEVAAQWLAEDAKDDFFVDSLRFADITSAPAEYIAHRQHRILQLDTVPFWREHVPKRSGMLREAMVMHPLHRVTYLGILAHFVAKLDARLLPEAYSYRVDDVEGDGGYPFGRRIERWKRFHNDFRSALLDPDVGAVLLTDLSSFYDHISCEQMVDRIRGILGGAIDADDEAVLSLLDRLIHIWCQDGHGIPQNYDPSSFFGSLYLHPVDQEMVESRYRYFRWVDDIRIVAKDKREALQALHHLQRVLASHRLFLATEKTSIIEKNDPRFAELLDVEDDQFLSRTEELFATADCARLASSVDALFERLEYHAEEWGDDRKFRAFANRLLEASDFDGVGDDIRARLQQFVIPRLNSHPERTDYWVKCLAALPDAVVKQALEALLVDEPSLFDWQRFHLWRLALHLPSIGKKLLDQALSAAGDNRSVAVAAQAIVCAGYHGDNTVREALFTKHFSAQRGFMIQRAVLIAIQEIPDPLRRRLYDRALKATSEHRELVDYLVGRQTPDYGLRSRQLRVCRGDPRVTRAHLPSGVGTVRGYVVAFALSSNDYDYE